MTARFLNIFAFGLIAPLALVILCGCTTDDMPNSGANSGSESTDSQFQSDEKDESKETGSLSGAGLESGLAVGTEVKSFEPIHYSGADAGTRTCPVCTYVELPMVVAFARQNDATLQLVKRLETLAGELLQDGLKVFVVMLDTDEATTKKMVEQLELENLALCRLDAENREQVLEDFNVNSEAETTVMAYRSFIVKYSECNLDVGQLDSMAQAVRNIVADGE